MPGDGERDVRVLFDHQHGETIVGVEIGEHSEDLAHDRRCEAERGLVAQQEPRPAHQRARDRQHLLLAAGQAAGRLPPSLAEDGEDGEPGCDVLRDLRRRRHRIGAQSQVLLDGEVGEGAAPLRNVGDAEADAVGGACRRDVDAVEKDRAARRNLARQRPQRRGLAGAVGAEQRHHVALVDHEVDAVNDVDASVARMKTTDAQELHAGVPR